MFVVRLWVDGLAHAAQDMQAAEVVVLDMVNTKALQKTNGGGKFIPGQSKPHPAGKVPQTVQPPISKLLFDVDIVQTITVWYVKLYNEDLRDLLANNLSSPIGSIQLNGSERRQIAATNFNDHSSRSHSVFSILCVSRLISWQCKKKMARKGARIGLAVIHASPLPSSKLFHWLQLGAQIRGDAGTSGADGLG
ncbi:hypothetical protein K443DRAFT_124394 [Laccaria amethystina LaAM-08-1]|uniref:Kinesin motor domain-containing protein n=1 Tax=Laccaria amethystina LaAM-08-1 TaxID=1095629 RepID=A0A0C9XK74_9AGAR|nr:hypothetical protein K443DRAFT_124394 [Laccaria amethystina LaAM-08-1]